jgi:hypothetical protein
MAVKEHDAVRVLLDAARCPSDPKAPAVLAFDLSGRRSWLRIKPGIWSSFRSSFLNPRVMCADLPRSGSPCDHSVHQLQVIDHQQSPEASPWP